jgi:hypothetical protein
VLCVVLLLGAIGFGAWAYSSRQDYKNNSDEKSAAASEVARKDEAVVQEKHFAEEYKKPLDIYNGPDALGSIHIEYPKTWSGYVEGSGTSTKSLDGYFAPGVVPSVDDRTSVFALRVAVDSNDYASVVSGISSKQKNGQVTVSAYALPKLPKVVGVRVVGQIEQGKDVDMVVLPLRSQTVQIWTEGAQYRNDFNTYILPNFSFSP